MKRLVGDVLFFSAWAVGFFAEAVSKNTGMSFGAIIMLAIAMVLLSVFLRLSAVKRWWSKATTLLQSGMKK